MRGIVVSLTLLALALPAAAGAQVPPGNSGIDQYQESIPGVGGNRPTGPNASGTGTGAVTGQSGPGGVPRQSRVSPSTAQSLEKLGPDGKGTLAAADATAPNRLQSSRGSDISGGSGFDPGMGWVLPVILALALAGAVTIAVLRRRRGAPPGAV